MTPQQKATEIYNKHYLIASEYCEEIQCSLIAKKCALVQVNDCLSMDVLGFNPTLAQVGFWTTVRNEIEKL